MQFELILKDFEHAQVHDTKVITDLGDILRRVAQDIHDLFIQDSDMMEEQVWWNELSSPDRRLLKELATSTTKLKSPHAPNEPRLRKCFRIASHEELHKAAYLARIPLSLVVENQFSDKLLIGAAIKCFGDQETLRRYQDDQTEPPILKVEHAGGSGEVLKVIDALYNKAQKQNRPPRILVMIDSDGEFPGEIKKHAQKIEERCREKNIPCIVLKKRTAENYIPLSCWEKWVKHPQQSAMRPAVDVLRQLSPEQWDHLDMKSQNLPPFNILSKLDRVRALYQEGETTLSDEMVETLKQADLKGDYDANFKEKTLRLNLLVEYPPTPDEWRERDHQQELKALVEAVIKEL